MLVVIICEFVNAQNTSSQPNFLFIMVDDQPHDAVGFSGRYPFLQTPNIDRLASEGVNIKNFFVTNFIKKGKIVNKDIFSIDKDSAYYFSNGWHIKAIYSLFIGFIFSAATIWNVNLMFLQSYSWFIGAAASSLTYYFLDFQIFY